MIIQLKQSEKTALANYLAEKSTKEHSLVLKNYGIDASKDRLEDLRKDKFKYYKNHLNETNDY